MRTCVRMIFAVLLPRFSLLVALSGSRQELVGRPVALAPELGRAQFIGCVGLQDEDAGRRLTQAFLNGWERVRSLRLDDTVDDTCWFAGDGWWLSTAEADAASDT